MPLSTSNRMYFFSPAKLGENELLIEEMEGREGISELFQFRLKLLSHNPAIKPEDLIGEYASLRIETWSTSVMGGERHWTGIVSRFRRTGRVASPDDRDLELFSYECELVPWIWQLTRHREQRIFQEKSIPDIIEEVLTEHCFEDFRFELSKSYPPLTYCTQYNENSYDFISRLAERAGIWFYFKHNAGSDAKHLLILTDNNEGCPKLDPAEIPFHHDSHAEDSDAVTRIHGDVSIHTGEVFQRDWDFTGNHFIELSSPTQHKIGYNTRFVEHYFHAADIDTHLGQELADVMMLAAEAQHKTLQGESKVRTLVPGYQFELYDHLLDEFNQKYLITHVEHRGSNNLLTGQDADYHNFFSAIPHEISWGTPLRTPRPRIHGPQTAIVVGPEKNGVHTDKDGRVKLQFHWDRLGEYNDKSSCWVRVAQGWAGNGYGMMFIPRVGMEVVVVFLDGDPDQPLVVGCVYNGTNRPPHPLPDHNHRSTIKTLSQNGGGGNELRFEDLKDKEEIFLQAQRDFKVKVKANYSQEIGGDWHVRAHGDNIRRIEKNSSFYANGFSRFISSGYTLIHSNDRLFLSGFKGAQVISIEDLDLGARNDVVIASAGNAIYIGDTQEYSVAKISLSAGPSSIIINPDGISIDAPQVRINCGANVLTPELYSLDDKGIRPPGIKANDDGTVTETNQQTQAQALRKAAKAGMPFCAECAAAREALEAMGAL